MTITGWLVYFLILGYFVIERWLRQGENALSLELGISDQGSSPILWLSGLLGLALILTAPVLNAHGIGDWNNLVMSWLGILLMLLGLVLRSWSARALGQFYTRTLQTIEGQEIIAKGPYSIIRHPGYLGTFLMEMGAGFAIANWVVLAILVSIGVASRFYRIQVEEEMLQASFGEVYGVYAEKTWKLIPFIY